MPATPESKASVRKAGFATIWIALVLAVLVIVVLSVNAALIFEEIERIQTTGVYPSELTRLTMWRYRFARIWGQFWWLLGPFILCAFPGSAALYRMVRFDSSNPRP